MDQENIERAARRLGSDAHIDVEQVAERVVAELRRSPAPVAWWRRTAALRAAAAVAVLLTGGVLVGRFATLGIGGASAVVAPVSLDAFSDAELTEVLDSLELARPPSELGRATLEDLNEAQLVELLEIMEG